MINILSLTLMGCPAPLKVDNTPARDSTALAPEVPEQFGIINTDSCDQEAIGSSVCNMVFYDQNKEVWELYDHEGKVVILDFSTVWCAPCQSAGHYIQPIQDDYAGNLEFVTVLVDGALQNPPTEAEVDEWVTSHNITTAPVLYADRNVLDPTGKTGYLVGGFPTYVFLDKELKIHIGAVGFNEQYVRSVIDGLQ